MWLAMSANLATQRRRCPALSYSHGDENEAHK
jgi:hypothetical protein